MIFKPYGIIISLAILAGTLWTAREFKKAGEDPDQVWNALPWVVIFGVTGARLYHVLHYWGYYGQDLVKILAVWHGGLGIYGGLLGGISGLGLFIYIGNRAEGGSGSPLKATLGGSPLGSWFSWPRLRGWWKELGWFSAPLSLARVNPFLKGSAQLTARCGLPRETTYPARAYGAWKGFALRYRHFLTNEFSGQMGSWLDLAAPGIVLGQAIGRVGNIFNGEILPYAIYEMVWDLLVFVLLVRVINEHTAARVGQETLRQAQGDTAVSDPSTGLGMTINKWLSGSRFALYLFLYALGRFFLEFTRTDNVWRLGGALSVAQLISLLIGVVIVFRRILESQTPRLQAPGALATGGQAQNDGIK